MSIGILLHNNDGGVPNDLFVTVNDLNAAGGPLLLLNQRINVNQVFPLNTVQEDGNGNGNIVWTVQSVDGSKSNQATVSVTDGQTVDVTTL